MSDKSQVPEPSRGQIMLAMQSSLTSEMGQGRQDIGQSSFRYATLFLALAAAGTQFDLVGFSAWVFGAMVLMTGIIAQVHVRRLIRHYQATVLALARTERFFELHKANAYLPGEPVLPELWEAYSQGERPKHFNILSLLLLVLAIAAAVMPMLTPIQESA